MGSRSKKIKIYKIKFKLVGKKRMLYVVGRKTAGKNRNIRNVYWENSFPKERKKERKSRNIGGGVEKWGEVDYVEGGRFFIFMFLLLAVFTPASGRLKV